MKSRCGHRASIPRMSLPVRERGLKYLVSVCLSAIDGSLPVRERGLKWFERIDTEKVTSRSLCGSVG